MTSLNTLGTLEKAQKPILHPEEDISQVFLGSLVYLAPIQELGQLFFLSYFLIAYKKYFISLLLTFITLTLSILKTSQTNGQFNKVIEGRIQWIYDIYTNKT